MKKFTKKIRFFRDLAVGSQVVINGELCRKIRPKLAMSATGQMIPVADSVEVEVYQGYLAA